MVSFDRVSRKLLVDDIVDQVFARLGTGELSGGQKLPSERELADGFGVSRTVVREALQVMRTQGVLVVRPGLGTFVTGDATQAYMRWSVGRISVQANPVLQVFELRECLEPFCAQMAAVRRNDEDLARIFSAVEEMSRLLDRPQAFEFERFASADRSFHLSVAQATQNPAIADVLQSVANTLADGMRLSGVFSVAWSKARDFHRQVAEAIRERAPERARDAMNAHLADVRSDLQRAVDQGVAAPAKAIAEAR